MILINKSLERHKGRYPIKYQESLDGCWICVSHKPTKRDNGDRAYFQMTIGSRTDGTRKRVLMHRYVYTIYHGEIQDGLSVRHKCDNAMCINPSHLEVGTHQDNMNDKKIRNRIPMGEDNASSKLTKNEVIEIRSLYGMYNQKQLGEMYGVSQKQISNIVNKKSWI